MPVVTRYALGTPNGVIYPKFDKPISIKVFNMTKVLVAQYDAIAAEHLAQQ